MYFGFKIAVWWYAFGMSWYRAWLAIGSMTYYLRTNKLFMTYL